MVEPNAHCAFYENGNRELEQDEQDWLRAEQDEQDWLRAQQETSHSYNGTVDYRRPDASNPRSR